MYLRKMVMIILVFSIFLLSAGNDDLRDNPGLGHYLHQDEIGRSLEREFYATDPPVTARNIAEFEQMEGVLIRSPFGISYQLIASFAEEDKVVTIVASQNEQNNVTSNYIGQGVNLANCEFLIANSDSYWTRDYGPWYIYDGSEVAIVNFIYNRPRPNDNDIPIEVADYLGVTLYGMPLVVTGGNYMTDGCGISASSDLVYAENPNLSTTDIDEMITDYLGVGTYHVLPDPNNTYIDHIDCWGKYLGVDKVLIREVPTNHAQYDEIEATAAYFASQNCAWGYPYEVYRVYTPNNQPYTNSLILNKRVYVPIAGSGWDDEAIAVYESALPGYEVLGFTGSWYSTDALHCRTKGIADRNMVHLAHQPWWQEHNGNEELNFSTEITAYSGEGLLADSVYVGWRFNQGEWTKTSLEFTGDGIWETDHALPLEAGNFQYYIHAQDIAGNKADHPFTAVADPHEFAVLQAIAYGDIDENGNIETYDAALLMRYIIGLDPLPELDPRPWETARIVAADVDGNGELDSYDVSLILQYYVVLITEFPVEQ